jgi:hypothetical protein
LLDESLPRKLKTRLGPHEVRTVPEMGWAEKTNGVLLRLANKEFEVFLTADQNLPSQQNLAVSDIAVVVLAAVSNRLSDIEPLLPKTLEILPDLRPGTTVVIS